MRVHLCSDTQNMPTLLILVSKMCLKNGAQISLWNIPARKQDYLFRHSVAPGNFALKRLKKIVFVLLSNRNFRKLFVNSEHVFRQGTLEDLLKNNGPLEEPLVVKFTSQLLSAVDYLHTNGKKHIVHKDVKG